MEEDSGNGIAEGDLAHVFEPFLAPSRKVCRWDSRSAGRSCKLTAGGFGLRTNVGSEVTVQVIGMHTLSPTVCPVPGGAKPASWHQILGVPAERENDINVLL